MMLMRLHGWSDWLTTVNGVVYLTVLAVPLSLLVVAALAMWRTRTGEARGWAWRRSLAEVGMVHGTVPWVWLTVLPGSGAGRVPERVSLVPFRDLATMGTLGIVANLLVLAALGFFAPMRFARVATLPRVLALGAVCSLLIEVSQYVFRLDRVSSVDDVLLNAAGAGIGGLLSRRWWRSEPAASGPQAAALR